MINLVRDNAMNFQAYVDFKRKFKVQELPSKEIAENGFKITDSDDINKPLLCKAKLSEITIKKNFTEWHYQHIPPEKEYPNFKFYLGNNASDSEEFCCNNFEHELKICYNIKTHLQVIKVKKVRNYNYNDMIEWITDFITHTKQFVLALFSVVSELAKVFKLSFLYLSYQKCVLQVNDDMKVVFFLNLSKYDNLRCILNPSISNLNDFIAMNINKLIQAGDTKALEQVLFKIMESFFYSYGYFRRIVALQYDCDGLKHGPNLDNVSFLFELMAQDYNIPAQQTMQTSMLQENEYDKQLVLIVNYRRLYQLGFKVDTEKKSLLIFDFAKQTYFYQDDMKPFIFVPFGENLQHAVYDMCIKMKYEPNTKVIVSTNYRPLDDSKSFLLNLHQEHEHQLEAICRAVFDYLGCTYLLVKLKQMFHWFLQNQHKIVQSFTKLDAQFNLFNDSTDPQNQMIATIATVIHQNSFQLELIINRSQPLIQDAFGPYFDQKIAKSFFNYKMIKGVVAILTSKLIQIIYIYELIYFEKTPPNADVSKMFMAVHSNQTELNELMMKSKLRIEFLMHTVDTQSFRYFCIKFIDPKTSRFKIVKFVDESLDGVYKPDGLKNERVSDLAGSSQRGKFLQRVLNLMTLDLNDFY